MMKYLVLLAVVLMFVFACDKELEGSNSSYDQEPFLQSMANDVVDVSLEQFKLEVDSLDKAVQAFASIPSAANLMIAQVQWKKVSATWRSLEPFKIGLFKSSFLFNRIDTWPCDTADVIADYKDVGVDVETKPSNNVGIYALEFMLFSEDVHSDSQTFVHLKRLSANLASTASTLQSNWDSSYQKLLVSSKGLALDGTVSELVNYLPLICEEVLRDKISVPIGYYEYTELDPKMLEAWKSESSLEIISATTESLKTIFFGTSTGVGFDDYLRAINKGEIADKATSFFEETEGIIAQLHAPLRLNLQTDYELLIELRVAFKKLRSVFAVDLPGAIGTMSTFSDVDGDG